MMRKIMSNHPFRIFGWTLAALLLLVVLLEGWRYSERPVAVDNPRSSNRVLNKAARLFQHKQQLLLDQTRSLANILKNQTSRRHTQGELFGSLKKYPQFWGTSLYQADQPIVWNGFPVEPEKIADRTDNLDDYVEVQKKNNVLLWIAHVGFEVQTKKGPAPYHLYTAKRIRQTNALPIGEESEYNLLKSIHTPKLSTIHIGIYESIPTDIEGYRVLHSLAGDSAGVVYASSNKLSQIKNDWQHTNRFWRAAFALFCFVVIGSLFYLLVDLLTPWKSLLFQIIIIGIGWFVFNQIHIAQEWLPQLLTHMQARRVRSYQMLCNAVVDSLFFLIAAGTLQRKLTKCNFKLSADAYFTTLFAAIGVAVINIAGILYTFKTCYHLAYTTDIPLLTLQIIPGTSTLLFFLFLAISLLALTITLVAIDRFLLMLCHHHHKMIGIITSISFIIGFIFSQLFISGQFTSNLVLVTSVIFYALIFLLSFLYEYSPGKMPTASALRNAAIYSFIISLAGSIIIYQAQTNRVDVELKERVKNYSHKKDQDAQKLTSKILSNLYRQFKDLGPPDFQNRIPFIQASFTQTIKSALSNSSRGYSVDLQMVDSKKKQLATYSTNLSSPDWVHVFNLPRLKAVMNIQQITKQSNRPIIQQPTLEDANMYQTFYRGWIPIFGNYRYNPIAWILCSVYRERPNLNKPMRAVMASQNYVDKQASYLIQEYKDNKLQKTIYQGIKIPFPVYNHLHSREIKSLQRDSTVYYTSSNEGIHYRNMLLKQSTNRIAKISTIPPGLQDVIFLFFRLSCSILIIGFIILYLYQSLHARNFAFSQKHEQFRLRILDSFLLATLVFLILLVFVTHFAIHRQNKEIVKQQLFEKLEPITQAAAKHPILKRSGDHSLTNLSLDSLATPINVDASLYDNRIISQSTTPQIYQQHLLPDVLPYPVYYDLFISQKRDALTTVHLDRQELLIGYRSILSAEGEPVAAIAIPTFVQSPKFNKQQLQITSYLIILYLLIFGLFIIASTFISRQLTRPIYYIRQGLQKISEGDLDTTIPVTSQDEVGSLAQAYNTMVRRLNDLQQELAAAEREEAWKEMAQQVAHEIKNPLTPMKLNIQHLQRQMASGDYSVAQLKQQVKKMTDNIALQIQSLNNIASDFSQFSKPIDKELTPLDVNRLIDSIIDLYDHDENITLQTKKAALSTTVLGVDDELRRVIINLVKNAHEALENGGIITLKTYVRGESIFVEVRDNGSGINEEDKPNIFEPNFSTKTSGTGLGLAICKKIIQAHNGSISFASILGEGTNFVIKLPLYRKKD